MNLEQFNKQAFFQQKPTTKLRDLPKDTPQIIESIRVVNGQYGANILVELRDNVVFLPQRVTSFLRGKEAEFSNQKYLLIYRGLEKIGKHESPQFEIKENK